MELPWPRLDILQLTASNDHSLFSFVDRSQSENGHKMMVRPVFMYFHVDDILWPSSGHSSKRESIGDCPENENDLGTSPKCLAVLHIQLLKFGPHRRGNIGHNESTEEETIVSNSKKRKPLGYFGVAGILGLSKNQSPLILWEPASHTVTVMAYPVSWKLGLSTSLEVCNQ